MMLLTGINVQVNPLRGLVFVLFYKH